MRIVLLLALTLTACDDDGPKPKQGDADACASAPEALLTDSEYEDTELAVSGTVTEVLTAVPSGEFDVGYCAADVLDRGFRLDVDGQEVVIGFNVRDENGNDLLPTDLITVGDELDVLFRSKMVWGSVEGVTVRDTEGLRLAVEHGSWGGALEQDEVDGLDVRTGKQVAKQDHQDCGYWSGREIEFIAPGQETVILTPVETDPLTLEGQTLTAVASAAVSYHEGSGCSISDISGRLSWALYR
ncbi:MAG: hypothetical protein JRF63_05070 [Deltaproteobacteria bacterium]|nr:hypothetical protein [Deltaproteobacteria bacterium]